VTAYRLAPVSYAVGKMLVKVPFFSLVNLIAGEEIVTELLQEQANSEQLAEALQQLVYDRQRSEQIRTAYTRVRQILGSAGASRRAADLALCVLENPVR
jgi:lipid-A-disaccharide synthase